ncbi:hypothetical protein ACEPAH_639 [Sanghuangporus vaninii]
MSEVVAYSPTPSFKEAAAYLSSASSPQKVSNETKLELYGIYKFLTASLEPTTTRPSIFSPTERAKYDAWKSAGAAWRGKEPEAEQRYIEIARSLGWTPGTAVSTSPGPTNEPTAEELLADTSTDQINSGGGGSGLGQSVSVLKRDEVDEEVTLHNLAIKGDTQELDAFIESHAGLDVNAIDEFGFTALHLACDRGNVESVKVLLRKGADASLKDSDGLSALVLAEEAGHEDIAALLRTSSQAE